jgi:DNA-binding response OmpR family regulator
MTPEIPDIQNARKPEEPVILSDFRPPEADQSVILVADDNALVRNLVGLLMQHDGYCVLSAADGQEALELSRQYPGTIDLVITDVEMPGMSGADLCGHLLEERPGIKLLVMMSGGDTGKMATQAINMPFLRKPFDGRTLREKVEAILAGPRRVTDLTNLVSELHAELRQIDQEILSLEQSGAGTKGTRPRSVAGDTDKVS